MHDNPFVSGNHLRACRALAGLEQAELALEARISSRGLRYWEKRTAMPRRGVVLALLAKAIRARGVTITESGCQLENRNALPVSDSGNG